MRSGFAAFLRGFVLPFGATTGTRIVFDGDDGAIIFYDAGNNEVMRLEHRGGGTDPIVWGAVVGDQTDMAGIGAQIGIGGGGATRRRTTWHGAELDFGYQAQIEIYSESLDHTTDPPAIRFGTSNGGLGGIRGPRMAINEGADSPLGLATLVAGAAVVNNQLVQANTRIFLTRQTPGGTVGDLSCAVRVADTSFTIQSTSALDTSTVAYLLWEPGASV